METGRATVRVGGAGIRRADLHIAGLPQTPRALRAAETIAMTAAAEGPATTKERRVHHTAGMDRSGVGAAADRFTREDRTGTKICFTGRSGAVDEGPGATRGAGYCHFAVHGGTVDHPPRRFGMVTSAEAIVGRPVGARPEPVDPAVPAGPDPARQRARRLWRTAASGGHRR